MPCETRVAFTGHRPNKLGGYDDSRNFKSALFSILPPVLAKFPNVTFITGMALGVDQWAAEYAISHNIPFDAFVPFFGQECNWPAPSRDRYRAILKCARFVTYVSSPGYTKKKMQIRNEAMVDACDRVIAVWNRSNGGTANCVRYAMKMGKPVYVIDPDLPIVQVG